MLEKSPSYGGGTVDNNAPESTEKNQPTKCEGCRHPFTKSDREIIIRNREKLSFKVKGTEETFWFHNEGCVVKYSRSNLMIVSIMSSPYLYIIRH